MRNPLRKREEATPGRAAGTSARPQVFSYYASQRNRDGAPPSMRTRSVPDKASQSNNHTSGKRFTWGVLPTVVALAAIGLSIAMSTTLTTKPRVRVRIADTGDTNVIYRPHDQYQQIADEALAASALNRSKLSLQREAITEAIQQKLPEATSIRLATPLVTRELVITIETAAPGVVVRSQGKQYLVTRNGTVITEVSTAEGTEGLPIIEDQTGTAVEVGQPILTKQDVDLILALQKQFAVQKTPPVSYVLPRGILNELHLRFADKPYYVKIALNGDARVQAGTYLAMKENLEEQGITPAEYIDVRVEGRAYYR